MGWLPALGGVWWLVFIGIVWGGTNPLIRRGARISEERQARRRQKQLQQTTGSSSATTGRRWQEEKEEEDDEEDESVEKRRREKGEETEREEKEKKKKKKKKHIEEDVTEEGKKGVVSTFVGFWANLLCQWEYLVPFALNLSGSVFFFAALGNHGIAQAVPIVNATTFSATAVAGWMLGDKYNIPYTLLGLGFVLVGISLCTA